MSERWFRPAARFVAGGSTDAIPTQYRRNTDVAFSPRFVAKQWLMPARTTDSPLGPLTLTEENGAITALSWGGQATDNTPLLLEAESQLARYFQRDLTRFTLPLAPKATASQQRFLDALLAIPYGETMAYGEIARNLNISAQAAGQACGANPIAILIPCHRVTGATNLGGFSAPDGIEKKVALLKLEGAASLLI